MHRTLRYRMRGLPSADASVSYLVPCWYALSHLRILCMQPFIRDVTMRISQRSWDGVTIHPAMWLWTASYAGYLFVFRLPIASTVRILVPLFPLSLLVASYLPKSRWYRPALVVLSVLMSAGWVIVLWGNMLITRHIVLVP